MSLKRAIRNVLGTAVLVAMSAVTVFAQGITTGSINGTVEDQQHAVVAGASVTAINAATNSKFSTQSSSTGFFVFTGVPVGTYNVTIEALRFSKLAVNGVQVNANIATSLGARALSLGTETVVTVADTAPLIQSEGVNISGTFETKKVADLPLGNGFDALALFTPGVVDTAQANFSNANGPGLSANGQRGRSNNFQIDGQYNNDNSIAGPSLFFGNQDAIQEVQVLTNFDAQYGRNMGSVVNYVTKQGTNAYHGDAYEIYTGNWADSMGNQDKTPLNGFCQPGQDPGANDANCKPPVVPRDVDNRFGGTMGGPILKDKLWFFGSGNFQRVRVGATVFNSGSLITPTPTGVSELAADFPGNAAVSVLQNIGPTAVTTGGAATFQNVHDVLVSATGVNCATNPAGCVPVQFGQTVRPLAGIFNDYEGSGRIDYQITPKDRFFGRYIYQQELFTNVAIGDAAGGSYVNEPGRSQAVGLDYVRDWSANFINQMRFSYSRSRSFFEGGAFPNCVAAGIKDCPTNIVFQGGFEGFGAAANMPQGRLINVYSYQDNATWVRGRHTLKFGGEYDRQRSPNVFLPNINGAYTFKNFNAFLANAPRSVTLGLGSSTDNFKENDLGFYAQDDWRVRDNLTLTFGLRWEWEQQAINLLHDETVTRESNPATAFWDPSLPVSLRSVPKIPEDLNNFGPVFGFSYTPRFGKAIFGEDKTVIRGGFRVAYDPEFYNMFLNVATSTPTVDLATVACTGCLPASGGGVDVTNALSPLVKFGGDPGKSRWTTVAPNFHNPYTEQWQFGVQRELTHGLVAEVRYVGNHDVGQFQDVNANPAVGLYQQEGFGSVVPAGLTPCTVPNTPGFGVYPDCTKTRVVERGNTGWSIYHALQSELRMSNFHGVTAGLAYTWSHTIDNANEVFNPGFVNFIGLAYPQNPFNVDQAERGTSQVDFPNVASLFLLYDTPWFKGQSGWKGHLLGGWEINPVWRYNSGEPYTVIQTTGAGPGNSLTGLALCDPTGTFNTGLQACHPFLSNPGAPIDAVGQCTNPTTCAPVNFNTGANTTASAVHWIVNDANSDAFFHTFVGAGRNLQRGDVVNNMNLSLFKNVKINERVTVQLRSILYNVTNSQFRGTPDALIDDGSFNPAANCCSFGNTFFNPSGDGQFNSVFNGVDRRRLEVGAKLIF